MAGLLIAQLAASDGQTPHHEPEDAGVTDVANPEAFYRAVRENLARAQQVAHQFSYKERRTTLHTNPFGKLGTDGTQLYEVYPAANPGLTYRRLLERDGRRLTADEIEKQDREYRMKASRARIRREGESDTERRRRQREEAEARQRAQDVVNDIVAALTFTIRGRDQHEGRRAIVVAFEGRPEAHPKTREGRIAQKFAGMIWIDADLNEVITVEARSTDDLAFGFGIVARLNKGAVGSLSRRPVEGGLWMPTALRLSGSGRAAMYLRKLTINYAVDWFDYQRAGQVPIASGVERPLRRPRNGAQVRRHLRPTTWSPLQPAATAARVRRIHPPMSVRSVAHRPLVQSSYRRPHGAYSASWSWVSLSHESSARLRGAR